MGKRGLRSFLFVLGLALILAFPLGLVNILPRGGSLTGTRDGDWDINNFPPEVTTFMPQPTPVLNNGSGYTVLGVDTLDLDIHNGENVSTVQVNLTVLGSGWTDMLDDGLGDDAFAYDDIFTLNISIPLDFTPGTYYLGVKATDNGTNPGPLTNESQNITLVIAQYNRVPELRPSPPAAVDMIEGGVEKWVDLNETVFFDTDVDEGYADELSFDMYNGTGWVTHYVDENITIQVSTEGNATFNATPYRNGQWEFMFRAQDNKGYYVTHNITVTVTPVNDPPVINTSAADLKKTAYQGEWLNATFTGWDPHDAEPVTFQAELLGPVTAFPAGFTFHPNGTLEFLPANEDVGTFWVNVSVHDAADAFDWMNVTIEVINQNDPPAITYVNEVKVDQDTELVVIDCLEDQYTNFTIVADDPDLIHSEKLTYTSDILNPRFAIEAGTGNCSFLPENDDVGMVNGTLYVQDKQDEKVGVNITLNVINVNDAPVAQAITFKVNDSNPKTPAKENLTVTFSTTPAMDVDAGDELTYIWDFDDETAGESGVDLLEVVHLFPSEGTYNITLTVQDKAKAVNSTILSITVLDDEAGTVDYTYKPEDLERDYSDPKDDVMSYTREPERVFIEMGEEAGIDLVGLACEKDGNYLKIDVTFASGMDSNTALYIYFVKPDHNETQLPGSTNTLPTSYVPSASKYLYKAKSNAVSITEGEASSTGLRYEFSMSGSTITFRVMLSDMEKEGLIPSDFELFVIADLSNATYYARDTIGAGAAGPPEIHNKDPDGGEEEDKGLFGLGKFKGIDIFWFFVAGGVLVLIVIILIVVLSIRKKKKDEAAAEEERERYFATPAHGAAARGEPESREEDDRYKVTYDMYEDQFEPPSPMLPGSQPQARSPFDISNLLQQNEMGLSPAPSPAAQQVAPPPATDLPPMGSVPDMMPPPMMGGGAAAPALPEPSTPVEEAVPELTAPEVAQEEAAPEGELETIELQPVDDGSGVQELQPLPEMEPAGAPELTPVAPLMVNCYNCSGQFEVTSDERPLLLKCPHCGADSQLS